MSEWKDTRRGVDGAEVWLLYPGILALLVPIYLFIKFLAVEDFTGLPEVLTIIVLLILYLIDRLMLASLTIPKLKKQIVGFKIGKKQAEVSCYFNKKCELSLDVFKCLEACDYGYWYLRYSYLSDKKDNYCLTTCNGQKFYISGNMPEVESLIAALKSIIQKNQENVECAACLPECVLSESTIEQK